MSDPNLSPGQSPPHRYERLLIDRFEYRGFHGCRSWCRLEVLPLRDGRVAVIATEVEDNPGTSVTNVAEHLASFVCDTFKIDPDKLVWVEHYAYGSAANPRRAEEYDLVTFVRLGPQRVLWSPCVTLGQPDGRPGHFDDPQWRPMSDEDWCALGLDPRGAGAPRL